MTRSTPPTKLYRSADLTPEARGQLAGRAVAVVGYGNQGRSQALNLRDSGLTVIVGNRDDEYAGRARADGFEAVPVPVAAARADAVMMLLPDEVTPGVFARDVAPHLAAGKLLSFASGYTVAYGLVACPAGVDVVLLAPRMVGPGVRDLYLSGDGFFSFIAVEQDATGTARDRLLALADAIGTLRKGALEVTFRMEAELDLFNEQAFGPAFGRVLLTAINTLIRAGYPPEAVLMEFYLSGEMAFIFRDMAETGLFKQLEHHSPTSQYGAISRGIRFLSVSLARPMKGILAHIRGGGFAREWQAEQRWGRLRHRLLKAIALRQPLAAIERRARKNLGLPE